MKIKYFTPSVRRKGNAQAQLSFEQKKSAFSITEGRCSSTKSVCRKAGVVTHSKNVQYDFPTALSVAN